MHDKLANHKFEAGLTRGVLSFTLGSISVILLLEPLILERALPQSLWPWFDRLWPWLMGLLPLLGLFFGAIGLKSRGKYLAIIGMTVCLVILASVSFLLWLGR